MDDFRASAPDQRGPVNPNVESIPFEDMKERILKIVKGYNGWVLAASSRLWPSGQPMAPGPVAGSRALVLLVARPVLG